MYESQFNNDEKKIGLLDTLKSIDSKLSTALEEGKIKNKKLPWRARMGKRKVKSGYVIICYLRVNKSVALFKAPIVEGIVELEGKPHTVNPIHIWNYKNKPFIIQPEWSTDPIAASEHYDETARVGMRTIGLKPLAAYMENNQLLNKKKFGWGAIIFAILIIGGIGYYAIKSGAFS